MARVAWLVSVGYVGYANNIGLQVGRRSVGRWSVGGHVGHVGHANQIANIANIMRRYGAQHFA